MSLGLSYGPIVSSLDNQAALRKRNLAQQNNSRGSRPTMAIREARGVRAKKCTVGGCQMVPFSKAVYIWYSRNLGEIILQTLSAHILHIFLVSNMQRSVRHAEEGQWARCHDAYSERAPRSAVRRRRCRPCPFFPAKVQILCKRLLVAEVFFCRLDW